MRDWLTQKIKTDVSERAQGGREWLQRMVDLNQAAYDALRNPEHTANTIIFDDEDNYNASLDMAWRGIAASLVIFGIVFSILSFLSPQDMGISEFFFQLLLAFMLIFGVVAGYVGLFIGLKFWSTPENLTSKRLFHVYATWAGPTFVLNYVAGAVVAVVGALVELILIRGGNGDTLYQFYQLVLSVFTMWSFCSLMYFKFGYTWWQTLISYFVGVIGVVFGFYLGLATLWLFLSGVASAFG